MSHVSGHFLFANQSTLCRYSMVLIGAAFFHRRYLQLFQNQPPAVHALVDETQNCDDIALNFVVSLYLRKHVKSIGSFSKPSGVFVKPVDLRNLEKEASSGYQGMWHRPEHLLQRSYCLNKLTQIYGFMPLTFSNMMVSQFGFPSYANHKSRGWGRDPFFCSSQWQRQIRVTLKSSPVFSDITSLSAVQIFIINIFKLWLR